MYICVFCVCNSQGRLCLIFCNSSPSLPWQDFVSATDVPKCSKVTGLLLPLWVWMEGGGQHAYILLALSYIQVK